METSKIEPPGPPRAPPPAPTSHPSTKLPPVHAQTFRPGGKRAGGAGAGRGGRGGGGGGGGNVDLDLAAPKKVEDIQLAAENIIAACRTPTEARHLQNVHDHMTLVFGRVLRERRWLVVKSGQSRSMLSYDECCRLAYEQDEQARAWYSVSRDGSGDLQVSTWELNVMFTAAFAKVCNALDVSWNEVDPLSDDIDRERASVIGTDRPHQRVEFAMQNPMFQGSTTVFTAPAAAGGGAGDGAGASGAFEPPPEFLRDGTQPLLPGLPAPIDGSASHMAPSAAYPALVMTTDGVDLGVGGSVGGSMAITGAGTPLMDGAGSVPTMTPEEKEAEEMVPVWVQRGDEMVSVLVRRKFVGETTAEPVLTPEEQLRKEKAAQLVMSTQHFAFMSAEEEQKERAELAAELRKVGALEEAAKLDADDGGAGAGGAGGAGRASVTRTPASWDVDNKQKQKKNGDGADGPFGKGGGAEFVTKSDLEKLVKEIKLAGSAGAGGSGAASSNDEDPTSLDDELDGVQKLRKDLDTHGDLETTTLLRKHDTPFELMPPVSEPSADAMKVVARMEYQQLLQQLNKLFDYLKHASSVKSTHLRVDSPDLTSSKYFPLLLTISRAVDSSNKSANTEHNGVTRSDWNKGVHTILDLPSSRGERYLRTQLAAVMRFEKEADATSNDRICGGVDCVVM